jgi:hypothetical protein
MIGSVAWPTTSVVCATSEEIATSINTTKVPNFFKNIFLPPYSGIPIVILHSFFCEKSKEMINKT